MSKVPSSWSTDKLGNISEVIMGQSPSSETYNQNRKGLPFFQGKADFGDKYPETRMWCSQPQKISYKGDILFSVRAPVGDVNVNITEACIGRGLAAIRAQQNSDFLYYQLIFSKSKFVLLSQGSTFEAINGSELKDFEILLPPLSEQKKIAEILTSVDRVIELTSQEIDKLKDLKKGMMQELLTKGIGHTKFKDSPVGKIPENWEENDLNNMCERINVGFVGACEEFYSSSGVPMIRTGDLIDGKIDVGDLRYVTEAFHIKNKKSKVIPGDILIARHGKFGNASIVPLSIKEANCLNVIVISPNRQKLLPEYLSYYLNSELLQSYFRSISAGSTQSVINTSDLIKLKVCIPALKEQLEIIKIGSSIDFKIDLSTKKYANLLNFKKGLMSDLLTGKVRVKV